MPWRFVPLGLIVLVLILGYVLGWHEHVTLSALIDSRAALQAKIEAHPLLSAVGLIMGYAFATAIAFPAAALLTIAAGFLFGWLVGGTLVIIGATAGATALFLAARTAFGTLLRKRVGGRAAEFAKGFEEGAFGYLLVLRLAPIFPFWLVNIVPAFFRVPLRIFVAATTLGIIPATYAYAYLGQGLESALLSASAAGRQVELHDLITRELTLSLGGLAVVAALALIIKRRVAEASHTPNEGR
ncbi:TVP38/TMEM64 family protein [Chelativorans sp. J32]|uniref:TVP38/TMEM64 family protein n=1 Tax=Chelativorans sp. J32 TaxID=935840 RepID=UPI0004BB93B1|nr:VTT domain-containing protein [Chelativorans sp. J32]